MQMRRLGALVALSALPIVTALAEPAHADPSKFEPEEAHCDNLGTIDIATNGNGKWTPAHDTDSNIVLVPYRFHFEFTPVGGTTEVFDLEKPAPKVRNFDRCTFGGTDSEGTFSGIAWVTYTPAK